MQNISGKNESNLLLLYGLNEPETVKFQRRAFRNEDKDDQPSNLVEPTPTAETVFSLKTHTHTELHLLHTWDDEVG